MVLQVLGRILSTVVLDKHCGAILLPIYHNMTSIRAIHTIDMNISFDINDNSVFPILLLFNNWVYTIMCYTLWIFVLCNTFAGADELKEFIIF
jgi:hypothetical protein